MTTIYDISQTLRPQLPVWPGDTSFDITTTWQMDENCPVLVSKLTLSTHSGTHADAPSHYDANGVDIANTGLVPYLGDCQVVHVKTGTEPVGMDDLVPGLDSFDVIPTRLLIRTFDRFPHQDWPTGFRAIDAELIRFLGENGCLLIGTDTPSLDPQESKSMDAHHAVRDHHMAILEGLVLDDVSTGNYELIALPLKIDTADASPVRAILRIYPDDN